MFPYILRRLLISIPVLWIIASATFFMVRWAPGGPFDTEKVIDPQIKQNIEAYYGFDRPLGEQYLSYLGNLLKGDLGPSFKYPGWKVSDIIFQKLPISFELGVYALAFSLIVGIPLGILAASKPHSWRDHFPMGFALIGISLPNFVIGPLLIWVFAVQLHWFHATGWTTLGDRVLPMITLGLVYAAAVSRLIRNSMLEVLSSDYIRTAQAKGVPRLRIYTYHALRNALSPVIALVGSIVSYFICGSFAVETIFNIPGLGRFFINASFNRDYTMILGIILFYAVFIVLFNLVADIFLIWVNPKKSYE